MQATAELYVKACASRCIAGNTLSERELRAEGSIAKRHGCSFMGREVSAARKGHPVNIGVGDAFGHKH